MTICCRTDDATEASLSMKSFHKLLLVLTMLAGETHVPAWAHAMLESAVPAKNALLLVAPNEVSLHFNERIEAGFSSIKVLDAGGKNFVLKKAAVDAADPKTLRVTLDNLKPGKYVVKWVGVGHDGHRRTGDYSFSVR